MKTWILMCALFMISMFLLTTVARSSEATGRDFQMMFPGGTFLRFQHGLDKSIVFHITDRVLNGSGTLWMGENDGYLRFIATDNCQLRVIYFNLTKATVTINQKPQVWQNDTTIFVFSGDDVLIEWGVIFEPHVPIGFIFGMAGFLGMFLGPCYCIHKLKKRDYYEGVISGFIITLIGICLVLAWLWG